MFIRHVLEWLGDASLAGTVTAAAIFLLRLIPRRGMDARWYYGLWSVLLIRLALPRSPAAFLPRLPSVGAFLGTRSASASPLPAAEAESYLSRVGDFKDYALTAIQADHPSVVFGVWLLGTLVCLAFLAAANVGTVRRLRGMRPVRDADVLAAFERCKAEAGIRSKVRLMQSDAIVAPALYGLFSPVLLLPSGILRGFGEARLRYVILHELGHLRRKDALVNACSCLLQSVHWFNPVLACAFHLMRQDRESACDACVLDRLSPDERREYGSTLLAFAAAVPPAPVSAALLTSFGTKESLKRRLNHLVRYRRPSRRRTALGGLLFLLVCCVAFAAAGPPGRDAPVPGPLVGNVVAIDLSAYFSGFDACFVLYDAGRGEYSIFNEKESRERTSPDSTFKPVSALVGLENGVLRDLRTELIWDGTHYPFAEWNRNHTLESAMRYSVTWFFEDIDRKVGSAAMRHALIDISYGDRDLSGGIGRFWDGSSLKISPIEQVEFLRKLYEYRLPVSPGNVDLVRQSVTLRDSGGIVLTGKTGTAEEDGKAKRGWFVGSLRTGGDAFYFATRIRGTDGATGAEARKITLCILEDDANPVSRKVSIGPGSLLPD